MTTTRTVRDQVQNVLDYLTEAELALHTNTVSLSPTRVAWHAYDPAVPFLTARGHATLQQYLEWVVSGNYSAVLFDASLLQITYDVEGGRVSSHRLAYVPCPFIVDRELLELGEPIADVVELHRDDDSTSMALRSPVRFDYDPQAAKPGHPAVHMTINSADCRIACVAPMHVHRFVDFVFRHFYPQMWRAHAPFFSGGATLHLGDRVLSEDDRLVPHLTWDVQTSSTDTSTAEESSQRSTRGGRRAGARSAV